MVPNYKGAAAAAVDSVARFGPASSPDALLKILSGLPGVCTFALDISPMPGCDQWDALTCVRRKDGVLQYVVMYNSALPSFLLLRSLARELGHIVLQHDGSCSEDIWMEEACCFAYHFLCCAPARPVTILYRPYFKSVSAQFKAMQTFDSYEDLKQSVADELTRTSRFIGKTDAVYSASDIEIRRLNEKDIHGGWKEYSSVVLAGRPLGYCGV